METLTVGQLTRKIRNALEFHVGEVWVEGEISNLRKQASGHQYFTIKDSQAQLACVFFRGSARFSKVTLADGAHVRLFGEVSVYETRGQYQLVVRQAETVGAGALHQRFEELKEKLRREGLFDESRRKCVSAFPRRVGIITSPTGAALRDMLNVLKRRAPWVHVVVYPVRVQGDGAYRETIAALEAFAERDGPEFVGVDTLVLARGGGSLEDLWNYNEEALARAISACPLPVVSAVGHEIDFTIADFVADLRAPTPSAAAELIVPDGDELRDRLNGLESLLTRKCRQRVAFLEQQLQWMARSGFLNAPRRRLRECAQHLDTLETTLTDGVRREIRQREETISRLENHLRLLAPVRILRREEERLHRIGRRLDGNRKHALERHKEKLIHLAQRLRLLGPEATLARGFAIVSDERGRLVRSDKAVTAGDRLHIRLHEGEVTAQAE